MTARLEQMWPLFVVSDMHASLAVYCDGLGFRVVGAAESDGSVYWCRLERGGVCLMLQRPDPGVEPLPSSDAHYFICDDADLIFEELLARGVDVTPPELAYYGMKQVTVPEPDGRTIVFESPTEAWAG
jgi:catechol 2,3-dioxygenase-like lactoylglutathione lyase family enzyme